MHLSHPINKTYHKTTLPCPNAPAVAMPDSESALSSKAVLYGHRKYLGKYVRITPNFIFWQWLVP